MEKTPRGTAVGVDDPYAHAGRCDHLTDEGICRLAVERPEVDREFARDRARQDFACVLADAAGPGIDAGPDIADERGIDAEPDIDIEPGIADERGIDADPGIEAGTADPAGVDWAACEHYRCRDTAETCARCGLEEVRLALEPDRPLLEEHHLSYPTEDARDVSHEITVTLCRWCHARVHDSWARVDDDVSPDQAAIAAREARRTRELEEAAFASAAERYRARDDD